MFKKEKIYIAGPECFYDGGFDILNSMKQKAEIHGFGVTLPNNHPLDMENEDLQKRADSIFADLAIDMCESTVIIADLEAYRGSEADSGTIYEIGMAYARGIRCYGYTRDKRLLAWKDQKYTMRDGKVYDEHGKMAPYKDLPFSPTIIGSTKIIEGDFDDCLKMLITDIEEEYKSKAQLGRKEDVAPQLPKTHRERPLAYLSGPERYDENAVAKYSVMKAICNRHGIDAVAPIDWASGVTKITTEEPYTVAANLLDNYQKQVRNCDIIIANLNDYRGYECSNDTGFECGMAFQLGKILYGYMDDTRPMKKRIPHLGEEYGFRDMTGANVENFNYPLNLMFSCSMKIFEGKFEQIIEKIQKDLYKGR
ncbi:MAG: nucleoside 2-deoxyribosyltransferase [Hungatella sp.]